MKLYVLGFLFENKIQQPSQNRVVLIKKNKPEWQAGLFNGVGGKVELHEGFHDAMVREFYEETGMTVANWHPFARMLGDNYICECFSSFTKELNVRSMTDEVVVTPRVSELDNTTTIHNVPWLVWMALDPHTSFQTIKYGNQTCLPHS